MLSPVRLLSSTVKIDEFRFSSFVSAGTIFPDFNMMISPGTKRPASKLSIHLPSLDLSDERRTIAT